MTATEIIQDLRHLGVELEAVGDRLRFRPKEAITPALMQALKQHKAEVIAALTSDKPPGLCPGPEKCKGCYQIPGGRRIHPPRVSEEWTAWLTRWQPGNGQTQ